VAGVDDEGWGEEGVADVGAGTAAVEGVLAEGLRAVGGVGQGVGVCRGWLGLEGCWGWGEVRCGRGVGGHGEVFYGMARWGLEELVWFCDEFFPKEIYTQM
jgi:hypothetical protein